MLIHVIGAMKNCDKGKLWPSGLSPFGLQDGVEVPTIKLALALYKNFVYAYFALLKKDRKSPRIPIQIVSFRQPERCKPRLISCIIDIVSPPRLSSYYSLRLRSLCLHGLRISH